MYFSFYCIQTTILVLKACYFNLYSQYEKDTIFTDWLRNIKTFTICVKQWKNGYLEKKKKWIFRERFGLQHCILHSCDFCKHHRFNRDEKILFGKLQYT